MDEEIKALTEEIVDHAPTLQKIVTEFEKVIVGQEHLLKRMISALLTGGHLLVEGAPGLAKTLSISTLARLFDMDFKRIQFTPDLLPADIRGTMIYNVQTGQFDVKKGPIFTNFVLADEINRAPAKVQSALLEAMQERTVTLGETTYDLPSPFFVMATQNPIEHEGTYPLPEAQIDRFYMKILVSYPSPKEEKRILHRMTGTIEPSVKKVASKSDIQKMQKLVSRIYVDEKIYDYVVNLVQATRNTHKDYIRYGASPRAAIAWVKAAKVEALMDERGYVIPEDVKHTAHDILRHRLILNFEAEAEGITPDQVIDTLLQEVEIP
ncbi:MoxR-like ATPase in aerotolerance operon [Brevinematales bacterium NS]|jgi:MoxR-like ATPase|nr:MoxR family ATPase [Brevinematales bacterium]QJR23092.1 MoxR-like ATPase in aerotolerance operon [Brevinematales bacterium NS]